MKYVLFLSIAILISGCVTNVSSDMEEPALEPSPTNTPVVITIDTSVSIPTPTDAPDDLHNEVPVGSEPKEQTNQISWFFNNEWLYSGSPPKCPDPLIFQTPVDVNLATSILYPGQYRGNDYKPHGGFRFDSSDNEDIVVRVPIDSYINRGSRYLENGRLQYMFEFINSCGIMYRFDHLYVLSPKLIKAAEKFGEPKEGDSRTTNIEPVPVEAGEVVATAVGVPGNVFVDWGVYDLRQRNKASEEPSWLQEHSGDQAPYAVCWLDIIPAEDSMKVKSLPGADSSNGKQSDYC
jgi:hypothetical protein